MSNAVKFSDEDSSVIVSVSAHEALHVQNRVQVEFSVTDFGEGIEESKLKDRTSILFCLDGG